MNVFVTGGSGYLGAAIVEALVKGGHSVSALVRSETSARKVAALGARAVLGELEGASWQNDAAASDGLVHTARDYAKGPASDRDAVDALLAAAGRVGSAVRSVVYTSALWAIGATGDAAVGEEASTDAPAEISAWRPAHERYVLGAGGGAFATAVVRPGIVWGGDGAIVGDMFAAARAEGAPRMVGDGRNRWPMIHLDDNASLYVRILEQRAAGIFHAADGLAPRASEVAHAVSLAAGCGGKVREVPLVEARASMGSAFADALCVDQVVVAPRSRGLGWVPKRANFAEHAASAWREWSA